MLRILLIAVILVTIACGPAAVTAGRVESNAALTKTDSQMRECITVLSYALVVHRHPVTGDVSEGLDGRPAISSASTGRTSHEWAKVIDQYCLPVLDEPTLATLRKSHP